MRSSASVSRIARINSTMNAVLTYFSVADVGQEGIVGVRAGNHSIRD